VSPRLHLADLLRTEFGLTGLHVGCEHGICGACNVLVDGVVIRGCLTLAIQADGAEVITIEGLTENTEFKSLQQAFAQRNALQCGFCTSGILMTAWELVRRKGALLREHIREQIAGNYCRCTGYQAIVDAIESVAAQRSRHEEVQAEARVRSITGAPCARPNATILAEGRGTYTDDVVLPNMAHVVFVRSPHAHARIASIDVTAARSASEVCWQGEAVAAVVAATRAQAEDAAELIEVEWNVLPAVIGLSNALEDGSPVVHTSMSDNLAVDQHIATGDTAKKFSEAAVIVEHSFRFGRQTAVTLEPRCILALFDQKLEELTVYLSHQAPFQMGKFLRSSLDCIRKR
jgi:aerobic-type carbon monoxide dehydrogenase small subunit (CoxS/CutS family)